jgi:hypothetical protein
MKSPVDSEAETGQDRTRQDRTRKMDGGDTRTHTLPAVERKSPQR